MKAQRLVLGPLVGVVVLAGGCSADSDTEGWVPALDQDASVGADAPALLPVDDHAASVVTALRNKFLVSDGDLRHQLVPEVQAEAIEEIDGWLVPRFRSELHLGVGVESATVRLPKLAADPFVVESHGVKWSIRPLGVSAGAQARAAQGAVVYPGAVSGASLIQIPGLLGTEEYVLHAVRPRDRSMRYEVEALGAAGYRLYGGVLEVLDGGGNPVLRTKAPTLVDAAGTMRQGTIALEGCEHDESGAVPWGRPVTPPGSERCVVVTSFDDDGLTYPIMVDPAWTNTAALATKRYGHTATEIKTTSGTCSSGCVVVVGGQNGNTYLATTEVYNEVTGTWSAGPIIPGARGRHAQVTIPITNEVMVMGGYRSGANEATTYTWRPGNSSWTFRGNLPSSPTGVYFHAAAYSVYGSYSGGVKTNLHRVYVTGGASYKHDTDTYDPIAHTWSASIYDLTVGRHKHAMTSWTVPRGPTESDELNVLVAGGVTSGGETASVEIGPPFSEHGAMSEGVQQIAIAETDTDVYFGGGIGASTSAKLYRISKIAPWTTEPAGTLSLPRYGLSATSFGTPPTALFTGGIRYYSPYGLSRADTVGPAGLVAYTEMNYRRIDHKAVRLQDGKAMVVGGWYSDSAAGDPVVLAYPTYEELFSPQANGASCTLGGECRSLYCVDQVCCNSECSETCEACSVAKMGQGSDGTCGPIRNGQDPDDDCAADPAASCDLDGACDGAGSCRRWAAGTSCGTQTCVGGAESTPTCDGYGSCLSQVQQCDPYVCGSPGCLEKCASNADCRSSHWCRTSDSTCQPDQDNGNVCNSGAECGSGDCVDGVCCDSACTGPCVACTATLKMQGTDGVCGPILSSEDPQSECEAQPTATCSTTGVCNGSGACQLHPAGTQCKASACSGTNELRYACNGLGTCGSSTIPCSPLVCTGTACPSSCTTDTQCLAEYHCVAGVCQQDKVIGSACTSASQCASGHCIDGFCCDSACTGPCQACSTSLKGQGANGVCGSIQEGQDPQSECPAQDASTCGTTGVCSGVATCQLHPAGSVCSPSTCNGGNTLQYTCNGLGTCGTTTVACAPYVCDGTSCAANCASDGECIPSYYCRASDSTCQADLQNGTPCSSASQCASGNCVDGVCCDTACTGTCQSCSGADTGGADGACASIPPGSDPDNECTSQAADTCGTTGTCSGAASCALHPAGTACGITACSQGTQSGQACNGTGDCIDSSSKVCAPYQCNGSACGTTCSIDADCVATHYCRTSDGTCQPDQPNGEACTAGSQCSSSNCVDEVCCDTACTGLCAACSTAKKGGGVNGACGPIAADSDPENECEATLPASCGTSGTCNGNGACAKHATGTACGTTSCSAGIQTGTSCDGLGACIPSQTTPCAPFTCAGSACASSCYTDADCVGTYWCRTSDHTCQPDQDNGSVCAFQSSCKSGNCVDGVCCDTQCEQGCYACSSGKKGQGIDGSCGPIAAHSDPDDECFADDATSCGQNGHCDGSGACELYVAGSPCGATVCSSGVQTGQACNGAGVCIGTQTTACSPYACVGNACATGCTADADCTDNHYCRISDSTCQPDQPLGGDCTSAAQCLSGQCVDGFCCDQPCSGSCRACSAAKKGAGIDGECGDVANGQDPDGDCEQENSETCRQDGACDGSGECRRYSAGTSCGASICQGSVAKGAICNGLGLCQVDSGGVECGPAKCIGGGCADPCSSHDQCMDGNFCDGGHCQPKAAAAEACSSDDGCLSGFCVDGVCCDKACEGQCEACDEPGSEGECTVVTGAPRGSRPDCGGQGDCAGVCDGNDSTSCAFPGSAVVCGQSCVNAAKIVSACNGDGTCVPGPAQSCVPYACVDDTECATSCETAADCIGGMGCDSTGACVSDPGGAGGSNGASGSGGSGAEPGDAGEQDAETPKAPVAAPEDSGGCGCRTTSTGGNRTGLAFLALLALVAMSVRKSSRRQSLPCGRGER